MASEKRDAKLAAVALMPSGENARHWRCHRCGVDLPLDEAVCGGCGSSSRQPEALVPPPRHVTPRTAMKAIAWRCPKCRKRNDIQESNCSACGSEKPPPPPVPQPKPQANDVCDVFSWLCSGCGELQSVKNSQCSNCSRDAPFLPIPQKAAAVDAKKEKTARRKKLESWICGGCYASQPLGHVRCQKCSKHVPRLPDEVALRQLRREVEKLRKLTEDLKLLTPEADFSCPVCFEDVSRGSGCRLRSCPHDLCKSCLAGLVEHSEGRELLCPVCPTPLDNRDARNAVSTEIWERHVRLLIRREDARRPFSFQCTAVDCAGRIQVVPSAVGDASGPSGCLVCGLQHCSLCRAPHEGRTCEEHRQAEQIRLASDVTEAQFEALKKRGGAMHCPSCSALLEKIYGCDWMKCPACDTEVCWATKGPRWGPKGKGDITGGCRCRVNGVRCSPDCTTCY